MCWKVFFNTNYGDDQCVVFSFAGCMMFSVPQSSKSEFLDKARQAREERKGQKDKEKTAYGRYDLDSVQDSAEVGWKISNLVEAAETSL